MRTAEECKRKKFRKRKSTRILSFAFRGHEETEPGDLLVCPISDRLYRAEQSSGWGKRMLGEFTPREIKPPPGFSKIVWDKNTNELYWV
jgi:hypothetical protein